MSYDGKEALTIDNENCNRCMHCIANMTKALKARAAKKGATILIGSKAPFVVGGRCFPRVIVPFMKMEPPYDEIKDLTRKIWEWWDEHGKTEGEDRRAYREERDEDLP